MDETFDLTDENQKYLRELLINDGAYKHFPRKLYRCQRILPAIHRCFK